MTRTSLAVHSAFLAILAALSSPLVAWGQAAAPPARPEAPLKPLEATVVGQIPDGAMAFLAIKDLTLFDAKIGDLVRAAKPHAPSSPPPGESEGFEVPEFHFLEMVRGKIGAGPGFNASDGIAVVLLDRTKYGPEQAAAAAPQTRPAGEEKQAGAETPLERDPFAFMKVVPVVLFPGIGPEKVLTGWSLQPEPNEPGVFQGDAPWGEKAYVRQVGAYVAVSDSKKAMAAVADAKKSILASLTAQEKDFISRNDVAFWVSGQLSHHLIEALVWYWMPVPSSEPAAPVKADAADGDAASEEKTISVAKPATQPATPDFMAGLVKRWKELLGADGAVCLGGQFSATGTRFEMRLRGSPNSSLVKAVKTLQFPKAEMLSRLPMMQYALAVSSLELRTGSPKETESQLKAVLAMEPFDQLPEKSRQDLTRLLAGLQEQARRIEFAAGAISTGKGQVGLAVVADVQSAAETRKLLASLAETIGGAVKETEGAKGLAVRYQKGKAGSGGQDLLSVDLPPDALDDKDRQAMTRILGSDKLTLRIGQVDDGTLVATIGGEQEFFDAAMKAAASGNGLGADAGIAKVLEGLPKKRLFVGALNLANGWDVIKKITGAAGDPRAALPPLKIDTHQPLTLAAWVDGTDVACAAELPVEPLKQLIQAFVDAMATPDLRMGGD